MYITQLVQKPSLIYSKNQIQKVAENCSITDNPSQSDQYSYSFKTLIGKVLGKINHKNNFFKQKQIGNNLTFFSVPALAPTQQSLTKTIQGIFKTATFKNRNLAVKYVNKGKNLSNLQHNHKKPVVFNKTSVAFIKNKQHRKSIQFRRSKSLSTQITTPKSKRNLEQTYYNERFSKKIHHQVSFDLKNKLKQNLVKNAKSDYDFMTLTDSIKKPSFSHRSSWENYNVAKSKMFEARHKLHIRYLDKHLTKNEKSTKDGPKKLWQNQDTLEPWATKEHELITQDHFEKCCKK